MLIEPDSSAEADRIRQIYSCRDQNGRRYLYSWHLPDVRYQEAVKTRILAKLLQKTLGKDLSNCRVLDVGCGSGGFLRTLVEWGANPCNLTGTEFLEDRLARATIISPEGMKWHLGDLDVPSCSEFDMVSAHTVFSSILDKEARRALAKAMWKMVKPGGWIMIFDFRYNNPTNRNVRKVTRKELESWWPGRQKFYQTVLLAPPLARKLIRNNYILPDFLTLAFPFLRSHFFFIARK